MFLIDGLSKDVCGIIWKKLNSLDRLIVTFSKYGNEYFIREFRGVNLTQKICKHGYFHLLKWVIENKCPWGNPRTSLCAAKSGNLEMLKWAASHEEFQISFYMAGAAAKKGHIHILEWILKEKAEYGCSINTFKYAAGAGRIEVLEWLYNNNNNKDIWDWNPKNMMDIAVRKGQIQSLKWFMKKGIDLDKIDVIRYAARMGRLEVLQWLEKEGLKYHCDEIELSAAGGGHLEVIKWLEEKGHEIDWRICEMAAIGGYLNIIEWYSKRRKDFWNPRICINAAVHGNIFILQWAETHRKLWDKQECFNATSNSNVQHWIYSTFLKFIDGYP
jgi:hypothetical protein